MNTELNLLDVEKLVDETNKAYDKDFGIDQQKSTRDVSFDLSKVDDLPFESKYAPIPADQVPEIPDATAQEDYIKDPVESYTPQIKEPMPLPHKLMIGAGIYFLIRGLFK